MTKEELVASIDRDTTRYMELAASVFENGFPMTDLKKAIKHIEQGGYEKAMSCISDVIETSNALLCGLSVLYGILKIRARADEEA